MKFKASGAWTFFLFLALAGLNAALIFDDNLSLDHRNYTYTWLKGYQGHVWPESAFSIAGELFSDYRYEWFFFYANALALAKISVAKNLRKQSRATFFLLLLTSPFTIFGFANSYLAFTSALIFCAFLSERERLGPLFFAMTLHKGSVFLAPLAYAASIKLAIFSSTVLLFAAIYLKISGVLGYLSAFEVGFYPMLFLLAISLLPLGLLGVMSGRAHVQSLWLVYFLLALACWFVIPKLGNRVAFFLAVPSAFVAVCYSDRFLSSANRLIFLVLCLLGNLVGFFFSSARMLL
ncbi:hypothetical protein [Luminiphilus sp. nBUS_07]|uniref:hypothetical protein n=1 Tax=Luminiphilus sp. nBUS_07 TaxID=3395314 RepID=UPI003EB7C488